MKLAKLVVALSATFALRPEFDSSETHVRPTSSNGAGFRAMIRQNPRYMDC